MQPRLKELWDQCSSVLAQSPHDGAVESWLERPSLLELALKSARWSRASGWQNVRSLLTLAHDQQIEVTPRALAHALHAYPPRQALLSSPNLALSYRSKKPCAARLTVEQRVHMLACLLRHDSESLPHHIFMGQRLPSTAEHGLPTHDVMQSLAAWESDKDAVAHLDSLLELFAEQTGSRALTEALFPEMDEPTQPIRPVVSSAVDKGERVEEALTNPAMQLMHVISRGVR